MIDADGSIALTSGSTTRLITPSARTVGVNARLTPNGFHSTVIALLPFPSAAISLRYRHREFAAGQEVRRLTGQGDQRRLGERGDRAFASRAHRAVTLKSAPKARNVRETIAKLSMIEPSLFTGSP